jgi:WD40 repeat protein
LTNPLPRLLRGLVRRRRRAARPKRSTPLRVVLERLGLLPSPPEGSEYHAFISYSHHADDRLAPAIERGLQRFAKPWYQARALRIFRDESSLSTDPGLWSAIARGIDSSEHLIVLASEDAAKSEWCGKEFTHWCSRNGSNNILIVLSSGDIEWDKGKGNDFDWERTTALPRTVQGVFKEQPRYTDMRWAHSGTDLSLSHARFRDAIAELAAPLHGVRKDEIAGEEVRQHRRTIRIVRTAILLLLGLTALAVGAAVLAFLARNDAIKQRRNAVSRVLASQAMSGMRASLDKGALTAVAAYNEQHTPEARSSLLVAVNRSAPVAAFLRSSRGRVWSASVTRDGRLLATGDDTGLLVWDLARRLPLPAFRAPRKPAAQVAISEDGKLAASLSGKQVTVWAVSGVGRNPGRVWSDGTSIAFVPNEQRLVVGTGDGRLIVWDRGRGVISDRTIAPGSEVSDLEFGPQGTLVAATQHSGLVAVRYDAGRLLEPRELGPKLVVDDLSFGRGGLLAAVDNFKTVFTWPAGALSRQGKEHSSGAVAVAAGPRGLLATGDEVGRIRLWRDAEGGPSPSAVVSSGTTSISDLVFTQDGRALVSTSVDGAVVVWRVRGTPTRATLGTVAGLSSVGFASGNRLVAAGDGRIVVFKPGRAEPAELTGAPAGALLLAVDSTHGSVAAASVGHARIVLWSDPGEGAGRRRVLRRPYDQVFSIAFSPDGSLLAAGTDRGTVNVWRVNAPSALPQRLSLPGVGPVVSVAFDPTGRTIAATRVDPKVYIRDLTAGHLGPTLATTDAVTSLVYSGDGNRLAYATADKVVRVWDARSPNTKPRSHTSSGVVTDLAFAPDSETLAWTDDRGHVVFWDVANDQVLGEPLGGFAKLVSLEFRPDGTALALAEEGGRVMLLRDSLWDADSAVARLCLVSAAARVALEDLHVLSVGSARRVCRGR